MARNLNAKGYLARVYFPDPNLLLVKLQNVAHVFRFQEIDGLRGGGSCCLREKTLTSGLGMIVSVVYSKVTLENEPDRSLTGVRWPQRHLSRVGNVLEQKRDRGPEKAMSQRTRQDFLRFDLWSMGWSTDG